MANDVEILHCYRTFYPESQGGLEHSILEISANTSSAKVLTLAKRAGSYSLFDNRVSVHACRRWFSIASCCVGGGLLRVLRNDRARLLHFHFPWPFGDLVYLLAGRGRPLVITYHSDIVRQRLLGALYRPLMHRFLARADRIIATSQNYADTSEVLQRYRSKIAVIPLGITESNYPSVSRQSLDSTESRFGRDFMLFVGVLRYYKGLEYLVRAAVGQRFQVVIAGKGPEEDRLKALAEELKADNIVFAGFVSDEEKIALMQLCRAVVFPSHLRSEAFGITLVEGLMCGKPLISCEIGTGTSFVNLCGETGHVVAPADHRALQSAMNDLWLDRPKAERMGKAGRRRYDRLFNAKRMGESYQKLYSEVLQEKELKD